MTIKYNYNSLWLEWLYFYKIHPLSSSKNLPHFIKTIWALKRRDAKLFAYQNGDFGHFLGQNGHFAPIFVLYSTEIKVTLEWMGNFRLSKKLSLYHTHSSINNFVTTQQKCKPNLRSQLMSIEFVIPFLIWKIIEIVLIFLPPRWS